MFFKNAEKMFLRQCVSYDVSNPQRSCHNLSLENRIDSISRCLTIVSSNINNCRSISPLIVYFRATRYFLRKSIGLYDNFALRLKWQLKIFPLQEPKMILSSSLSVVHNENFLSFLKKRLTVLHCDIIFKLLLYQRKIIIISTHKMKKLPTVNEDKKRWNKWALSRLNFTALGMLFSCPEAEELFEWCDVQILF